MKRKLINELYDAAIAFINSEVTERSNTAHKINCNGRQFIELSQTHDLLMLNGRYGDEKGKFTCHPSNGGSKAVDYAIVSHARLKHVSEFDVDEIDYMLSDTHSALYFTISSVCERIADESCDKMYDMTRIESIDVDGGYCTPVINLCFRWSQDKSGQFRNAFSEELKEELDRSENKIGAQASQKQIDDRFVNLRDVLVDVAKIADTCWTKLAVKQRKSPDVNKPRFDKECFTKRKEYFHTKNKLCKIKSTESRSKAKVLAKECEMQA